MSRAEWELIEMARARALAERFEREAIEAAVAAGHETLPGQFGYALAWLATMTADRIVRLENARLVPDQAARGTAAPSPPVTKGGGVSDLTEARKSRR